MWSIYWALPLLSYLPCSYTWGLVADLKGRKPILIASSILLGLSVAVFGFSTHFAAAIVARFVVGITNGKLHKLMIVYLISLYSVHLHAW